MAMMRDSHNAFAEVSGHSRIQDVHKAVLVGFKIDTDICFKQRSNQGKSIEVHHATGPHIRSETAVMILQNLQLTTSSQPRGMLRLSTNFHDPIPSGNLS